MAEKKYIWNCGACGLENEYKTNVSESIGWVVSMEVLLHCSECEEPHYGFWSKKHDVVIATPERLPHFSRDKYDQYIAEKFKLML